MVRTAIDMSWEKLFFRYVDVLGVESHQKCFFLLLFLIETLFFTGLEVLAVTDTESYTVERKYSLKYILAQRLDLLSD